MDRMLDGLVGEWVDKYIDGWRNRWVIEEWAHRWRDRLMMGR